MYLCCQDGIFGKSIIALPVTDVGQNPSLGQAADPTGV